MSNVYVLIAIVGVIAAVNLILTLGIIRRLRSHAEHISNSSHGDGEAPFTIPAGTRVGDFESVSTTGEPVGRDRLGAATLVGFFLQDCKPCHDHVPVFADAARTFPGGRSDVLAVVVGNGPEAESIAAKLEPVARVVMEATPKEPVSAAFGVVGFPATVLVDADGVVSDTNYRVDLVALTSA